LEIILADDISSIWEEILIKIIIKIGSIEGLWNPDAIRRLLSFVAHNDILRDEVKTEIESTMEKVKRQNFVQKMENELLSRLICTEIKSQYLKLHCFIEKINLIWIQPILDTYFFQIKILNKTLTVDMTDDHFLISGSLDNFDIKDLSNYPFTFKSRDEYLKSKIKVKDVLTSNENNTLKYEYKSMNKWCPYCVGNYTSEAYVNINSANLFYIQENFLRFFNYLMGEFLGSFGPSTEIAEFRMAKNQIEKVDPKEIEFMRLYVIINNPKLILKARPQLKEAFILDLGTLIITSSYVKVFNKIREKPDEFRWLVTYKFELNNFNITTHDNFYLLNPTNGIANMHFTYLTEDDYKKSDLEVDKGFQIDVLLNEVDINLRQIDFANILKLNDLNISYFDYLDQFFDYPGYREKIKLNKTKKGEDGINAEGSKEEIINLKESDEDKKKQEELLKDTYIDIIFNLLVHKINLNLFMLTDKEKNEFGKFSKLSLEHLQLDFFRKLNTIKDIAILIESPKVFEYISIYNTNSNFEKCENPENEFKLIFSYDKEREKYNDNINKNESENSTHSTHSTPSMHSMPSMPSINLINLINLNPQQANSNNFISNTEKSKNKLKEKPDKAHKFCYEDLHENFSKGLIHFSLINTTKNSEISIKINIDQAREKSYIINISNLKMIIKLDTILLIKQFFLEGFPYYSSFDEDIPNLYEENEENYPGMRLFLEIKNPIISLLSDKIEVKNQDVICLSTDVIFGLKMEKIARVKSELLENHKTIHSLMGFAKYSDEKEKLEKNINEDKLFIYSMNVSLFDIYPYIISFAEFNNSDTNNILKRRKIIDNFIFIYDYQTFLKFIPLDNFIIFDESKIDVNKLCIKASYRDLVLMLRSSNFNGKLLNESYQSKFEDLIHYSKLKKDCENKKGHEIQKIEKISNIRKSVYESKNGKTGSDDKAIKIKENQKQVLPALKSDILQLEKDGLVSTPDLNLIKLSIPNKPLNAEINYFKNSFINKVSFFDQENNSIDNLINNPYLFNESNLISINSTIYKPQTATLLLKRHSLGLDFTLDTDENSSKINQVMNLNLKKSSFVKYNNARKFPIIDKGFKTQNFTLKEVQIVLIDDQNTSYQPFLSLDIQNFKMSSVSLNFNQNQVTIGLNGKLLIYNYLAATWEPLLERAFLEIDITTSESEENITVKTVDIKFPMNEKKNNYALNLNISDLTVLLLILISN